MAGVTVVPFENGIKSLGLQPPLKADIGPKSFSGALTNPDPPPPRDTNAALPGRRGGASRGAYRPGRHLPQAGGAL